MRPEWTPEERRAVWRMECQLQMANGTRADVFRWSANRRIKKGDRLYIDGALYECTEAPR